MQTDANHDSGRQASGPRSQRAPLLAIIILLALPVRLYLALSAAMISRDGVTFIWYAQGLARSPAAEMRKQAQHPLYPAMVLAAHEILQAASGLLRPLSASVAAVLDDPVQSWTLAGMSVSLLAGLAVVLAVYALARLLFDRRVGLLGAILAALAAEFCQLSADALTDMPHLALYLFGLCAAIRGLKACPARSDTKARPPLTRGGQGGFCRQDPGLPTGSHPLGWLFLSGLLSGLAFLMRPEGAEVALVAVVGVFALAGQWPLGRRLAGAVTVLLGAGLIASPYMLITGKLVQKKSILRLLPGSCGIPQTAGLAGWPGSSEPGFAISEGDGVASGSDHSDAECCARPLLAGSIPVDLAKAVALVAERWGRGLRGTVLIPVAVWLSVRKRLPADRTAARLVVAAGLLHAFVLLMLVRGFEYWTLLSIRHAMILAGLTLPFAAAGVAAVLDGLPASRRPAAGLLIFVVLVAPTAPWLFERRYADDVYLRRAGEWIRTQQPAGAKIHTTRFRVAFYANGVWQDRPGSPRDADVDAILADARAQRADWLAFDLERMLKESPSFLADLQRAARPGEIELAKTTDQRVKGRVQRALIYRYRPPA